MQNRSAQEVMFAFKLQLTVSQASLKPYGLSSRITVVGDPVPRRPLQSPAYVSHPHCASERALALQTWTTLCPWEGCRFLPSMHVRKLCPFPHLLQLLWTLLSCLTCLIQIPGSQHQVLGLDFWLLTGSNRSRFYVQGEARGTDAGGRCVYTLVVLSLVMSDGSLTAPEQTVDCSVRTDSHTASWFQCANLLVLLTDAGILTLVHLVSEGEA